MAYKDLEFGLDLQSTNSLTFNADNTSTINMPHASLIKNAEMLRDGMDLTLSSNDGHVTIENYFSQATPPTLTSESGETLSPKLVNAFVKSGGKYASNSYASDESPIGLINEMSGKATVTRTDGSTETITLGTEIYQGDIIETAADGAVNITFTDESSFAVSEDARLAIDEYVFDPASEGGTQDFSVLKGVFVYTSGLIGRDDPDDVNIDTPVGSIGIRGTIIAGDVNQGEITVVEGAIVLRDFGGNEITLANQFETAKFELDGSGIKHMGELSANDVAGKFSSVSGVAPTLFSSINDAATEQNNDRGNDASNEAQDAQDTTEESAEEASNQEAAPEQAEQAQEAASEAEGESESQTENKAENQNEAQTEAKADAQSKSQTQDTSAETAQDNAQTNDANAKAQNTSEGGQDAQSATQEPATMMKASTDNKITQNQNQGQNQSKLAAMGDALDNKVNMDQGTNDGPSRLGKTIEPIADQIADDPLPQPVIEKVVSSLDGSIIAIQDGIPKGFGFLDNQGVFKFNFKNVFQDTDNPDVTFNKFELGPNVEARLDQAEANGTIDSTAGWSFDPNTGELTLNLGTFNAGLADLNINIRASIDGGNTWSQVQSFEFATYDSAEIEYFTDLDTSTDTSIDTYFFNNASGTYEGQSDNATIFTENGINGTLEVLNLNNIQNATIFTGQDDKKVVIDGASENNLIITGDQENAHDQVEVNNANNSIHTMDGNDTVKLYLDTVAGHLNDGTNPDTVNNNNLESQFIIDGGSGQDNLVLFDGNGTAETLDLGALDTQIKNFETITLKGGNITLQTLNVEDVFSITDNNNELKIDGDSGSFNLQLGNGWSSGQTSAENPDYTEYTGQHAGQEVTLLVDNADITLPV